MTHSGPSNHDRNDKPVTARLARPYDFCVALDRHQTERLLRPDRSMDLLQTSASIATAGHSRIFTRDRSRGE